MLLTYKWLSSVWTHLFLVLIVFCVVCEKERDYRLLNNLLTTFDFPGMNSKCSDNGENSSLAVLQITLDFSISCLEASWLRSHLNWWTTIIGSWPESLYTFVDLIGFQSWKEGQLYIFVRCNKGFTLTPFFPQKSRIGLEWLWWVRGGGGK